MVVFHIRATYRLPSLSFHDNRASHSRDRIQPWKFKVKGQGQMYLSQHSVQLTLSLVFHIRASYRLPSVSSHDNRASHSRDTVWPWKFKVKGQDQRYPNQRSVQLTHFVLVSRQLDQPFLRYEKYNVRRGKRIWKFTKKIAKTKFQTEFLQNLASWKPWQGG